MFAVQVQVLKRFLYLPPAFCRDISAAGVQPELKNARRDQKRRSGDGVDPGVGYVDFQTLRLDVLGQPQPESFAG